MSGTWEVKEEYRSIFLEESQDQIQEWEESLLELEKDSGNKEQIDRMFRSIHTLKGSAGFVGFEELQKVTHDLESTLQEVRDGGLELSPGMIEILFEGHDFAKRMIEAFSLDKPFNEDIDEFIAKIKSVEGGKAGESQAGESQDVEVELKTDAAESGDETESGAEDAEPEPKGTLYRVGIEIDVEGKEAFLRSLLVQQRLEEAGKVIKITPSLEDLRVRGTEFKYEVLVKTEETAEEIGKSLSLDQIRVTGVDEASETEQKEKTGPEDTGEQEKKVKTKSGSKVIKAEQVVRVPVEKLDVMMNLVGELVVQNSGFISTTGELSEQYGRTGLIIGLEEKTESLAKIARDLQDAVMKVRMLPVATVFNRFNRVVRDLAKDRGKAVELVVYGEETEIDKKVIDRIGEPLVHLVRNAVDHGIETREERAVSGKDSVGHIKLGAYQEGDHICIEVSDDGKGLDRDKIEAKAVEKGLLKQKDAERMDDEKIFSYIFLPGFSTAAKVTDISGRGVGLDVVKRTVDEMDGVVRIKSERGRGTVTTISLPLTMAIIMAVLVEKSGALFALPLSSVNEVLKVKRSEFHSVRQSDVI
ncbi:MAG: chemotaxis protein CheA, partial [Spirochaetes bacterium]|nr:chemotaxis protein CheA [Spirochaetota bacterium]